MNAAIRAVTRAAIFNGFKVKGIYRGYEGLIAGEVKELTTEDVSSIIQRGNDWKERYSYQTLNRSLSQFGNIGINADYQHSFKRKGEYLTLSYKFNNSPNNKDRKSVV